MTQISVDLRDAFFNEVLQKMRSDPKSILISDDQGAQAVSIMRQEMPTRCINAGIAEQNIIDVAAGLALSGMHPFVYGITPFMSYRCFEQIYLNLSCMSLPITIIGSGGGFTYSSDGPTHHALNDLAALRSLPNLNIFNPSDANSTAACAVQCCTNYQTNFVRIEKGVVSNIHPPDYTVGDGFSWAIPDGSIALISSGITTHEAVRAAKEFPSNKIAVLDIVRIKPLDIAKLAAALKRYSRVIVIEEQSPCGGLFSIVCEVIAGHGLSLPVARLGPADVICFDYGSRGFLAKIHGIDAEAICSHLAGVISNMSTSIR